MKTKINSRILKILIIMSCIIAALLIGLAIFMHHPKVRLLLSVLDFKNNTMEEEGYLAYDVDLMELCREYFNSDSKISGEIGLNNVKGVNASIFADVDYKRSFEQKKIAGTSSLDLVFLNVGNINFYAQDETVFMDAPILGNSSYAFFTGQNLFPKMPNLTSDPNQAWYNDNLGNIIDLIKEIDLVKIESDYTDEDGNKCDAYKATIHKGSGHFIWELLDMDDPNFDISFICFITKDNKLRRIEADLSDILDGAYVIVEGKHMGKLSFTYALPDNESVSLILNRHDTYKNFINAEIDYFANNANIYRAESSLKWVKNDKGCELEIKDFKLYRNKDLLAEGYFKGSLEKARFDSDIFEGNGDYLNSFELIDWRDIRNDVEGFVKSVIGKMSLGEMLR